MIVVIIIHLIWSYFYFASFSTSHVLRLWALSPQDSLPGTVGNPTLELVGGWVTLAARLGWVSGFLSDSLQVGQGPPVSR